MRSKKVRREECNRAAKLLLVIAVTAMMLTAVFVATFKNPFKSSLSSTTSAKTKLDASSVRSVEGSMKCPDMKSFMKFNASLPSDVRDALGTLVSFMTTQTRNSRGNKTTLSNCSSAWFIRRTLMNETEFFVCNFG